MATINAATCKVLREEMNAALEAVGKKMGLKISAKSMRYDSNMITVSVDAISVESNMTLPKEGAAYLAYAPLIGMKPEWLEKKFVLNGVEQKIVGYNARRKSPVIVEADGRLYAYQASIVIRMITNPKAKFID